MLLLLSLAGCAGRHAAEAGRGEVRVRVVGVGIDETTGAHFVELEDPAARRTLHILIGDAEARAILLELNGVKTPRPLTHELLRSVIEKTGNRVDRIAIVDLRNDTYYAEIYLDHGRYAIDSRPSDAIALALGIHAPIFAAQKLFNPAAPERQRAGMPAVAEGFGLTVQSLSPELARFFNVAPQAGVLVADVSPQSERAGLERGDILTQIEGQPVKTAEEFQRQVKALQRRRQIAVKFLRAGTVHSATLALEAGGAEQPHSAEL